MESLPRPRAPVLAIEGISGAGKSTVTERYARLVGAEWVPEAFRRIRPELSLEYSSATELLRLERRLLREDALRYRAARGAARQGRLAVLDTGTIGSLTYSFALGRLGRTPARVLRSLTNDARAMLRQRTWGVPDRVVWIESIAGDRRRRIAADPVGHPSDLAARHEAVGRVERSFYRGPVARLLGPRFVSVRGDGPPGAVVARVRRALDRMGPVPPAPAELAAAWLDLFAPA